MGRRRCCCECWSFTDDFDRADSTDIGSAWNEVSGDWEIDTFKLYESSTTGIDKVIGTGAVPVRSAGQMKVFVTIVDPTVNDEFYIFLACTDSDGTGGEWVKFTYTSANTWLVALSSGESKTQTYVPVVSGHTPVLGCIDADGFLMGAIANSGDEYPWSDGAGAQTGRYYGLGHGTTASGAWFDDFAVHELRIGSTICQECFCRCGDNNLQKSLTLTIYNAINRASCMDGNSVTAAWEWNSGVPRWVSDVLTVTGGAQFKWYVECGSYDPDNPFDHLSLNWFPGYKTCCAGNPGGCDGVHLPDAATSTCDPLSLVFGPFVLSVGELTCVACSGSGDALGSYYIVVTET